MEITVLNHNNVPTGPLTREQVRQKLRSGEFTLDSLAFVEGLAEWTPLRNVLVTVDAAAHAARVQEDRSVLASNASPLTETSAMELGDHQLYAGFWLRFFAYLVDFLILNIPLTILSMFIGAVYGVIFTEAHPGAKIGFFNRDGTLNVSFILVELGILAVSVTAQWLYYALQECSFAQGTLGKRFMGLHVTNLKGRRIGFGQASIRFFGKILSGLIFLVGFLMAGFTEKKQALHDIMARTLVVRG